MDIERVLSRLVRIARRSFKADVALARSGFVLTPFFNLYGEAAEAICILIGDEQDDFRDTVIARLMENKEITDEGCIAELMNFYRAKEEKNHDEQ